MKLMDTLRNAPCLHDSGARIHKEHRDFNPSPAKVTSVFCSVCDRLLYNTVHDLVTGEVATGAADPVYRILYTKEGRRELLLELMKKAGLPMPEIWDDLE